TNLIQHFQGPFAYSYVFDGQNGYLDHALANASMFSQIVRAADSHIDSDEPSVVDYDTSFKGPNQEALYQPNAFRASDHDPLLVGLNPDGAAPTTTIPLPPPAGGPSPTPVHISARASDR